MSVHGKLQRLLSGALLLAALALPALLPAPAQAQSRRKAAPASTPSDPALLLDEKARATFKEGIAAFDRRDFEAARVAFLQTFALKPSAAVVRRNLGLAEIYSGHYLDGARRLARVLHTTDEGSAEDRARMLESLKKAEAHLERVSVEVKQDGAEIWIDGVDLGTSPLPFLWYVAPGGYEVNVQKAGFINHSQSRVARAGATQHLRIVLAPVPIAPPPARKPVATPVDLEPERPSAWVLVTGGVVTAGALASGTAFSLAAASNLDKVERLGSSLRGTNCNTSTLSGCRQLSQAADQHDRQGVFALASFIGAGVTGVATLLYGLLAGGDDGGSLEPSVAGSAGKRPQLSAHVDGRGDVLLLYGGGF